MRKTAVVKPLKTRVRNVIFESDTVPGKAYDIGLIGIVTASVLCVMLDSVASVHTAYGRALGLAEWVFTVIFTIDYCIRLLVHGTPARYGLSFFGIVDFLGVIPTYISLVVPGARYLVTIRFLRILRLFRVLKLVSYMKEAQSLSTALRRSFRKIVVFLFTVLVLVVVLGSLMYVIEQGRNGFDNIPKSIYWAIVTLTTVGYGDISPQTPLGQTVASFIMILGYSIIVIPTGIVTVDIASSRASEALHCSWCGKGGHDTDALYCKYCSRKLS